MTVEEVPRELSALLVRPLPEGFTRSVVTIKVGEVFSGSSAAWQDALVLVTSGAIDVETPDGTRARFGTGAVLSLANLPHCRISSSGTDVAQLVTVRRSEAATQPPV